MAKPSHDTAEWVVTYTVPGDGHPTPKPIAPRLKSAPRSSSPSSPRSVASAENLWVDPSCDPRSAVSLAFLQGLLRHSTTPELTSRAQWSSIRESVGFARSVLGSGSELGSIFTLVASAMGAGCLSLPHMLRQSGLALGLSMLLLGAVLAHISLVVLMSCARYTRSTSFAELLELASSEASPDGRQQSPPGRMQFFADVVIAVYGVAAVLCYMIFIGDFLGGIAESPMFSGLQLSRGTLLVGSLLVVFPLSVPKRIDALRYVCLLSTGSVVLTALVVAAKTPGLWSRHSVALEEQLDEGAACDGFHWYCGDATTTLKSLVISIFSFSSHTNAVPVVASLKDPRPQRIWRVSIFSVLIELAVYCLLAVCGYLSFLGATKQDFIRNYPTDDSVMFVVRCIYSVTVVLGVPINLSPAANSLQALARRALCSTADGTPGSLLAGWTALLPMKQRHAARPASSWQSCASLPPQVLHVTIVLAVLAICTITAVMSEAVADLIAWLGSSFGTLICLWWPCCIYRGVLGQLHKPRLAACVAGGLSCAALLGVAAFAMQARGVLATWL